MRLEDQLGPGEPRYRSRGEAQVGRLLNRYGIPFLYERPLVLPDHGVRRTVYPDFTLVGYGGLIVEYAGMPDRGEYLSRLQKKQRLYRDNGVAALLLYPQDLQGPDWPGCVVRRIEAAYHRSIFRYPARSSAAPPYRAHRPCGPWRPYRH